MNTRTLGTDGPRVSAVGLGTMGMSEVYGPADEAESLATIHAAIDAGVILIDTGDFYGMGDNELLLARALRDRDRDQLSISVKFGATRDPSGAWLGFDGRPSSVKTSLAYTLTRLDTDYVDIYRPARLDPEVPVEETVGAIAEMVDAGFVRHVGLSEVGVETIRKASSVAQIADLQIEYSLLSRDVEDAILPVLRELGIGMSAYAVLSRGLLSGHWNPDREPSERDFRTHSPRFQGKNLESNLAIVESLSALAADLGATTAQVAIAWVAAQGDDIVPLVGARRRDQLSEALGALELDLSASDLERIEAAVPRGSAAGERYAQPQMAMLDSERG